MMISAIALASVALAIPAHHSADVQRYCSGRLANIEAFQAGTEIRRHGYRFKGDTFLWWQVARVYPQGSYRVATMISGTVSNGTSRTLVLTATCSERETN
jgi:hypothetical protein